MPSALLGRTTGERFARTRFVRAYARQHQANRQSLLSRNMAISEKRQRLPKPAYGTDLVEVVRELLELESIERDWNGLGSEPPAPNAIAGAIRVLWALKATWMIRPERVAPSAEGGVGIAFRRGQKFASIESLNSGEIIVLISDGTGSPRAWEIDTSGENLHMTAQTLREHFEF